MKVCQELDPHLDTSAPPKDTERRRSPRRKAEFPVRIREKDGAPPLFEAHARAIDVSAAGILLELAAVPPFLLSSATLELDFRLPPGVFPDPYVRRFRTTGRAVRVFPAAGAEFCRIGVEFEESLADTLRRGGWKSWGITGAILFALTIGCILFLKALTIENFWHAPVMVIYSLGITAYILSRFLISAFYRSPRDAGHCPSVTVVVAVKNEEKAIGRTLERIFESDYPRNLLQVIAIDDGSTDGTRAEMEAARERHPRLTIIPFPRNLGKRRAMAVGAVEARGEILVFVDSDSFLERDTLRRLVQGFADPRVGAIAAHGFVDNAWKNPLTGMQAVQYYLAFKVLKAAESVFSSVTCCSGCCSAYRRSAVLEVLEAWRDQTFMGRPATFGDDRSLTNFMLRKYRVLYDDSAHVSTIVPETLGQFLRQQLRWKKSWLRETLLAASFMWRKSPPMVLSFFAGLIFPILAPLVVVRALLWLPLTAGHLNDLYLWGILLMSVLYAAYYLMRQKNRLWVYGILLCVVYTLILSWQLPWAMATSWNNKWGTR